MRKKLWIVLFTIVSTLALAFGISACSQIDGTTTPGGGTQQQQNQLAAPVVTVSENGVASWEEVPHALSYVYKVDDKKEVPTFNTFVQLEDGETIVVMARGIPFQYADSPYSEPVTYHKTPAVKPEPTKLDAPVVTVSEEGVASWEEVEHASGYLYRLDGGEEHTFEGETLEYQLEDGHGISVKALGDGELYSDSDWSKMAVYTAPVVEPTKLDTPVVTIDQTTGIASWEAVAHASAYFYKIGEGEPVRTEATSVTLEDGQTITVQAVGDGVAYSDSEWSAPKTYTAPHVTEPVQLDKPVVNVNENTGLATWVADEHSEGYICEVNGTPQEKQTGNTYQLHDGDELRVKAVGDGENYTDSEWSDEVTYTETHTEPTPEKLNAPVVALQGNVASWQAVAHADHYEYVITEGGQDAQPVSTQQTSVTLTDGQSIKVRAIGDGENYTDSEWSNTVTYTETHTEPTPEKLVMSEVAIDEDGRATWNAVTGAKGYICKVNDVEQSEQTDLYIQLKDGDRLQVKAVAENENYSDSDWSEEQTYTAKQKPVEPTQLATPEISVSETGLATWEAVDNAIGYKYKVNGETTEHIFEGGKLEYQLEDDQYIEVQAFSDDAEHFTASKWGKSVTYHAQVTPQPTLLPIPQVTLNGNKATWEEVAHATGYKYKIGEDGVEQDVPAGTREVELQDGQTIYVKAVGDDENYSDSDWSAPVTYTAPKPEKKDVLLATFELGTDDPNKEEGNQVGDGEELKQNDPPTTYTETDGDYSLSITYTFNNKLYPKAWDNKGNGCFRLGSGSNVGTFTFIVPEGVTKVVIYVAGYKSDNTAVAYTINGKTSETIIVKKHSATPEYEAIEILVTGTKESERTLTFTTVKGAGESTKPRCKINTIEFWGEEETTPATKLTMSELQVNEHTGEVTWNEVPNATGYTYTIGDGQPTTIDKDANRSVTLEDGETISVIAKGDGTAYSDSDPVTAIYNHEHGYKADNDGWTSNATEHYKECIYCHAHVDSASHNYENGTCGTCHYEHQHSAENLEWHYEGTHYQLCSVCNAKVDEHDLEAKTVEFEEGHRVICAHSGCQYTGKKASHTYTEGEYVSDNEQGHHQVCTACGHESAKTAHSYDGKVFVDNGVNHYQECACGYKSYSPHNYDPAKGTGLCEKCSHPHDEHVYTNAKYGHDATDHWLICDVCGKAGDKVDHDELVYDKDANKHWKKCPTCGWIDESTRDDHHFHYEGEKGQCEQCGYPSEHEHNYTVHKSNETHHWLACEVCGEEQVGSRQEHTWSAWTSAGDANHTCQTTCNGEHEDGKSYTKTQPHSELVWNTVGEKHYKECPDCDYRETSEHDADYRWVYEEGEHRLKCEACGNVKEHHAPASGERAHDNDKHWYTCTGGCGLHIDEAPHDELTWNCTGEQHYKECATCGYKDTGSEHKADYQWTVDNAQNRHYQYCKQCEHEKEGSRHNAQAGEEWKYDEQSNNHWHACTGADGCDIHLDEAAHKHDHYTNTEGETHTSVCVCGKELDTTGHNYGETYHQGVTGHYQICSDCEHHSKETEHTYKTTLVNDGEQGHHQVCEKCEYATENTPHTYDKGTHKCDCGEVDPDYTKAQEAIDSITLEDGEYYYDSKLTETLTTSHEGIEIQWTTDDTDNLKIEGTTLTITLPTDIKYNATKSVTLKAEVTVGEITLPKTVTFKLHRGLAHTGEEDDPFTVDDAKVIFTKLTTEGDYYPNKDNKKQVYVEGYVTGVGTVYSHGLNDVWIGPEMNSQESDSITSYNVNWGVLPQGSVNPLSPKDKVVISGFLEYYQGKQEITHNNAKSGKVYATFTDWLKFADRPENVLKGDDANFFFTYYSTEEMLAEGGEPLDLDFSLFDNVPDGMVFTLTSGDEAVTVQEHTLKAVGMPAGGKATITVKATYKGLEAERTFDITVTPFNYTTYLGDARDSIRQQIEQLALTKGDTSTEIKLASKYSDVTLEITCSDETVTLNTTSEGVYTITVTADSGTATFSITVTYNGDYTGKGQSVSGQATLTIVASDSPKKKLEDAYTALYTGDGTEEWILGGEGLTFTIDEAADINIEVTEKPEAGIVSIQILQADLSCAVKPLKLGTTTIEITLMYMGEDGNAEDITRTIEITVLPDLEKELQKFTQDTFTNLFGQFEQDEYEFDAYGDAVGLTDGITVEYLFDVKGFISYSAENKTFTVTKGTAQQEVHITVKLSYNGQTAENDGENITIEVPAKVVEDISLYTLDTETNKPKGSNNSYTSNCDITVNKKVWNLEGNSQENPWRIGGKSENCKDGADRKLTGKSSIEGTVKEIVITVGADSGTSITVNKSTLKVFNVNPTSDGAKSICDKEFTYAKHSDTGDNTISIINDTDIKWTNCYYQFIFNVTVTVGSNKFIAISKIEFKGQDVSDQDKVKAAAENLTIDKTDLTSDLKLPTLDGFEITWEVTEGDSNAKVVDNKTLQITQPEEGEEDAKVKLVATIELNGETTTKEFTLTVKAKTAQGGGDVSGEVTWTKVTNVDDLKVGDQIIIVSGGYAMSTDQRGNNRASVAITNKGNTVEFGADVAVQIITLTDGAAGYSNTFGFYVVYGENNTYKGYLSATGGTSGNYLTTKNELDNTGSWTISIAGDKTTIQSKNSTEAKARNTLAYNSSNNPPIFACYKSDSVSSYGTIAIYKAV